MGSYSLASIQLELATLNVSLQEVGATQTQNEQHQQQPDDEGGSKHLDIVRDVQGGATEVESHVGSESEGEDMAVSVARRNVVTITERGSVGVGTSNTDFGCNFEVVELATDSDSESVAEVGGHGLGFDSNRSSVIPPPRFIALDLRERLTGEEMVRAVAATKAARAVAMACQEVSPTQEEEVP